MSGRIIRERGTGGDRHGRDRRRDESGRYHFADALNFFLYAGKPVTDTAALTETERRRCVDQVYSISVLVLAVALSLPFLSMIKNNKIRQAVGVVILLVYIYGNLNETILGRDTFTTPQMQPELFASYRRCLKMVNGRLRIANYSVLTEIILNVLLYVPLGYILPFLIPSVFCPNTKGPHHHWVGLLRVMAMGLACSVATEAAQYFFCIGYLEIDDIWNNTMGTGAGFILYRIVMRLIPLGEKRQNMPER